MIIKIFDCTTEDKLYEKMVVSYHTPERIEDNGEAVIRLGPENNQYIISPKDYEIYKGD